MDFDDYDSYAPIAPEPPAPPVATARARLARAWIPIAVLVAVGALAFAVVPSSGPEATATIAAEVPATSTSTTVPPTVPTPAVPGGDDTTVTRVIDGDTIEVAGGTQIRFIGIDAPETTTVKGCFGGEAAGETRRMLPVNQRIRLVYDVERRDSFGRTLAYVYSLPDGRFVNLSLARDGFAVQTTVPPNVMHVEAFRMAVADARSAGRGLWAACPAPAPTTPATTRSSTAPLAPRGAVAAVPAAKPAYFAMCTAARAAGAAPLHRGGAGYRPALDRDSDGVACE